MAIGLRKIKAWQMATLLFALCLLLVSVTGIFRARAQKAASGTGYELNVKQVIRNVRQAIGYNRLKSLKRGFVVEEFEASSKPNEMKGKLLNFGPVGQYREDTIPKGERPTGFDGRYGWQLDRTGFPTPTSKRLREKLLIPAWVRSGWWLSDAAPLLMEILPAESNEKQVALSMRIVDGLVGAKVYIDRATWLPEKLTVEYERGPFTLTFKDYQETLGFRFPRRTISNYRGSDSEMVVRTVSEIKGDAESLFRSPAPPADTAFNNTLPAELDVAQGVRFSEKTEGHYYVRPLVDGREVGWFHFDTGSDTLQIDTKLADELKMPVLGKSQTRGADGRPQEVTIRQGKTFQLGRLIYKNPIFLASDMSDKNAPPGQKRAGYIGYPVMARAVVEVEGGGKRIRLYDPASYKLRKGKWQELSYIDLTPAVTCRFEGNRAGLFQLDTGYAGTVTFYDKFIIEQKLLDGRKVKEETSIGAGGTFKEVTGTIEWFELAGYRFNNPEAAFRVAGLSREGGAGVVGRDFLAPFTIVFDYPNRRIAFIR